MGPIKLLSNDFENRNDHFLSSRMETRTVAAI